MIEVHLPAKSIGVLVTEDSETIGHALIEILNSDPQIEVVGWAKNGRECLRMAEKFKPDIVTMDINMPLMDGIETTRALIKNHPTPILIVSSQVRDDLKKTFDALRAGAFDIIEKPGIADNKQNLQLQKILIEKVKKIAKKFIRLSPTYPSHKHQATSLLAINPSPIAEYQKLVLIGASTGGPAALHYFFSILPKTFPQPILVVLHMEDGFINGLVNWLQANSNLPIKIAEHNEKLKKGFVYFPPDNHFMGVTESGRMSLEAFWGDKSEMYSINFLMASAARVFHNDCIGILLTGMGSDGANGMKLIRDAGGKTIAQDEKSSLIFGMPKEALKRGGVDEVTALTEIPRHLLNLCAQKNFHTTS